MAARSATTGILLAAAAGVTGVVAGVLFGTPIFLAPGLLLVTGAAFTVLAMAVRAAREESAHAVDPLLNMPPAEAPVPSAAGASEPIERVFREPTGVEPADVLSAFAREACPGTTVIGAHLWLLDDTTSTVRLVTSMGDHLPSTEPLPVDSTSIGQACITRTARLDAVSEDARPAENLHWRYVVPLDAGDVRGAAALELLGAQPDREALNRLAAHLRGALSAALALHISRTETSAARSLLQAASDLFRLADSAAICETALDRAMELAGADSGSVLLLEGDSGQMRIAASRGLPERVVTETRVSEGDGIAGWVLATRQAMVVEDLEGRGPNSRRHGIRSAMAVPILDDEGVLGVLNVGSKTFHARFSSTHLTTLESLGRVLALALRNASAVRSSRDLYIDTVKALALALETKDPYSRGATERVFGLAERLGTCMGLDGPELQALRVAALLHDVGMAASGDVAALADRPLTTVEWGLLKMHPVISADVLEQAPALRAAVPIVYHHHEHYDGGGYMLGLSGEQIPLGARILSVADAYVSMTSPRPYRPALSHAKAMEELQDKAGSQFDPTVVAALAEHMSAVR